MGKAPLPENLSILYGQKAWAIRPIPFAFDHPLVMKATEQQRQKARDFIDRIEEETKGFDHGIEDAVLDDWNGAGSFQAALVLKTDSRRQPFQIKTNLQRLTPAIKRADRESEGVTLSEIDHPGLVQERNTAAGRTETLGHESTTTVVHFYVPMAASRAEHDEFFRSEG
jgi:hypothetical protein